MLPVTRRSWLRLAGLGSAAAATCSGAAPHLGSAVSRCTWRRWSTPPTDRDRRTRVDRGVQSRELPARVELLRPARPKSGRATTRDAAPRRFSPARIRDRRRRSRDRDRARRVLSGVDVQRPGAGPDDPRHGRRSAPHHVPEPGLPSAHDPLSRLASSRDGRLDARASGDAGRTLRLRVRCRAVRHAPLSLPRGSAEAPHPQGPLRRVHRRSAHGASAKPTSSSW